MENVSFFDNAIYHMKIVLLVPGRNEYFTQADTLGVSLKVSLYLLVISVL